MTEPLKDDEVAINENRRRNRAAAMDQIVNRGPSATHAKQILELTISGFGGPEDFAAELVAEFKAAKPGSHIRARIMSIIGHLMEFCSAHFGDHNPYAGKTRQELVGLLKNIVDGEGGDGKAA